MQWNSIVVQTADVDFIYRFSQNNNWSFSKVVIQDSWLQNMRRTKLQQSEGKFWSSERSKVLKMDVVMNVTPCDIPWYKETFWARA
jgi:hypothetical protein